MSKYIIELKDDIQVVQKVGVTENGNAFVMNFYKDQLEELKLNSDYINKHYGDLQDTAYQRGLDDAWECARKLYLNGACKDMFGEYFNTFIKNHTAQEAIKKLKAYKQDDKIEVGDEVAFHHDDGRPDTVVVVTYIGQDGFIDGMDGRGTQYAHKNPTKWTKTGRHFDIASILKEMQS